MDKKRLEEKLEKLQELERRLSYYEERQKIERLMFTYSMNHNQKNMHRTPRLYAFGQEDVSIEIADRGRYLGEVNVRQLFEGNYQIQRNEGSYLMHWQTTPMIEIGKDGKTAVAHWTSPGAETVVNKEGVPVAVWNFIHFCVDFCKEDGKWKFWHYRIIMDMKSDYDKGWNRDYYRWDYMGKMQGACEEAPIWNNCYAPSGYLQYVIPTCPRPYSSYTDDGWIFAEEPEMEYRKKGKTDGNKRTRESN